MPWAYPDKTPDFLKNKSVGAIKAGIEAGNAALARGLTEEEAVFAAIASASAYEKKHRAIMEVKPAKAPPLHLQAILDIAKKRSEASTSPQEQLGQVLHQEDAEELSKALSEPSRTIVDADFDKQNRLVIKFSDGSKITTRPIDVKSFVEQHIAISPQPL